MDNISDQLALLDLVQDNVRMDYQHRYQAIDPVRGWVPLYGVTSVIGQLAKTALEIWKLRQERDHMAKLSYSLRPEDDESKSVYAERLQSAAGEFGYKRSSSGAADRGHNVHSAIEKYITDQPLPKLAEKEQQMFENFKVWWDDAGYKAIRAEFRVFNLDHSYAGTSDVLLEDADGLILADWKTSKASDSTYPEHSLQSAAYRGALYNWGFPKMRGLIVQIDRNLGETRTHWLEDEIDEPLAAFRGLVKVSEYLDARERLLR